ncbi:BTB/POZ domain-containing protein 9-like [Oppia nitens]|uniref:BTB/POZ domain-containing protein 9-like n=1 Tax=Oppia nitens TaxID=1686743 RepID=UPI0023DB99D2|nr:BTB/POZ domain-containing protein 9-like [Oppia nitens]
MMDSPYKSSAPGDDDDDRIDLSDALLAQLSGLYMNEMASDIVFIVDGQRICGHKFVVCLRCDYFRLMFGSGLRESISHEVEIKDTPITAFKDVLYFMYTGVIHLNNKSIDDIIDILYLGHRYEMRELVVAITDYMSLHITIDTVCVIHETASLFGLTSLERQCQQFMLYNGYQLLANDQLMTLDAQTLIQLLTSDEFCAEEIDIFNAVVKYIQINTACGSDTDEDTGRKLLATVRLSHISWNDLIAYVWPSGYYQRDELLSTIDNNNTNTAAGACNRQVVDNYRNNSRMCCKSIMSLQEMSPYLVEQSVLYCRRFDPNVSSIVQKIPGSVTFDLNCVHFCNYLELDFGNCEKTGYSYYIEVAADNSDHNWRRIIDYTDYRCHSVQYIYFSKTAVKRLRIHCTYSKSGGTNFIINNIKLTVQDVPTKLYTNGLRGAGRLDTSSDYTCHNTNKCYEPLYGPQLDISKALSAKQQSILKTQ